MTDLESLTIQLNDLIIKGEGLKAMKKYYADDVSMQENEDPPRVGKQACLEQEKRNLQMVTNVTSKLLNQAIDHKNGVVFSEWEIIFKTVSDKTLKLTEVSVQSWEGGKIVKEKFYYRDTYAIG